jgi:activator of HSP90 ATPase
VGKLNFFRWALEKGILEYIKGHQTDIEKEMNQAMREQAKTRTQTSASSTQSTQSIVSAITITSTSSTTSSQTRKRQSNRESSAAIKLLQKHDCPIEMSFD